MRKLLTKAFVILSVVSISGVLLVGCGSKEEDKSATGNSSYYTGPMQGKGTAAKGKPVNDQ